MNSWGGKSIEQVAVVRIDGADLDEVARSVGAPVARMEFDPGYDHKGRPCFSGATITHADGRSAASSDAPWLPWMADATPGYPSGRYAVDAASGTVSPVP